MIKITPSLGKGAAACDPDSYREAGRGLSAMHLREPRLHPPRGGNRRKEIMNTLKKQTIYS